MNANKMIIDNDLQKMEIGSIHHIVEFKNYISNMRNATVTCINNYSIATTGCAAARCTAHMLCS